MLCNTPCRHDQSLSVDGVLMEFSLALRGTKVSAHTFYLILESQENSLGTMVTSRITDTCIVRETFLLTSRPSFQR